MSRVSSANICQLSSPVNFKEWIIALNKERFSSMLCCIPAFSLLRTLIESFKFAISDVVCAMFASNSAKASGLKPSVGAAFKPSNLVILALKADFVSAILCSTSTFCFNSESLIKEYCAYCSF